MTALLEIKNLTKCFQGKEVIHGINFEIRQGEILCLLGPNGAAKSTTISIICGALACDTGELFYLGQSVKSNSLHFKEKLGIVPQTLALYEDLTAEQNVRFFAALYGLKSQILKERTCFALEAVGLLQQRHEKVQTFSGGMKRRLNIACAIAHQPQLLIMDEPTVGIDPQSRNHILASIRKMQQAGMTVLYTTHYMEEVEEISDRIIIMDHGKIIAEGTSDTLKNQAHEKTISIELATAHEWDPQQLYQIEGLKKVRLADGQLTITAIQGLENLDQIIGLLQKEKQKIQNIQMRSQTLETVFLDLTGRSLRD